MLDPDTPEPKPVVIVRPRDAGDAVGAMADFVTDSATVRGLSGSVRRALEHMLANFAGRVSLTDLSALTQRTPYQIIRSFRRELGVTPHALLIRIRIQRATEMLERGEPIAAIAADVGFVDQTHFSRHFKRIHSQTPGRFRDTIRVASRTNGYSDDRGGISRRPMPGVCPSRRRTAPSTDPPIAEAA